MSEAKGEEPVTKPLGVVQYCYSPLPISHYHLEGVARDEFRVIRECRNWMQVWNLFWLSEPRLDKLPGSGARWYKVYTPSPGLLTQVVLDVNHTDDLLQALTGHPVGFLDYWSTVNARIFRAYFNQGGESWWNTVKTRAQEAEKRLLSEAPPFNFKMLKG